MILNECKAQNNYESKVLILKDKLACVMAEKDEIYHGFQELKSKLETSEKYNSELLNRIEFLKGQIEAYQYCMNCRR